MAGIVGNVLNLLHKKFEPLCPADSSSGPKERAEDLLCGQARHQHRYVLRI